jgi:serine/threonine protein kinase
MDPLASILHSIKAKSSPYLEGTIERCKLLGNGSFGVVHEVVVKDRFALKEINIKSLMDNLDDDKELAENLSSSFSEFLIMNKNLKNVVGSHQCYYDEDSKIFSFTMDLMKGDLHSLIKSGSIPFEKFYKIFQDIATGWGLIIFFD